MVFRIFLIWYTHKGVTLAHLLCAIFSIGEYGPVLVSFGSTFPELVLALGLELHERLRGNAVSNGLPTE